jgi:NADH-quinone oxidoreductase subunit N
MSYAELERLLSGTVFVIAPEVILIATVCVMFLLGPFLVDEASRGAPGLGKRWTVLALLALGAGAWACFESSPAEAAGGPFVVDGLSNFVRMLTFTLGPLLVLLLSRQIDDGSSAEANACLLAILAGVNLTSLAADLIGLFLALELVSIPTYVFLYLPRRDAAMQEATIKYFLLSVLSSAIVLMGMAWLFGAAGTTVLSEIAGRLAGEAGAAENTLAQTALALLIAGLSFRIAAVPFHFYAPDVFQGVNSVSAAMLSVLPKVAGFAALLRVLDVSGVFAAVSAGLDVSVQDLLAILAVLTMFVGNLLAMRQKQLHRLLAYSSIAHSGYMLAGLAVGPSSTTVGGLPALWFYLAAYGVTTIGVFSLLAAADADRPLVQDAELQGLSQSHPAITLLAAVCLFGLTGLPPTVGFSGKLNLFVSTWSAQPEWGRWLAAAIALNAAIGASYYLRLIALMYREPPADAPPRRLATIPAVAGGVCAVGSMLLFAAPQRLWDLALQVYS